MKQSPHWVDIHRVPELPAVTSVMASLQRALAAIKAGNVERRCRAALAELDPSLLRDIGVAEDEIPRLHAREPFTPRAWTT